MPWQVDLPQLSEPLILQAPGVMAIGGGWQVIVQGLRRVDVPVDFVGADPWTAYLDADAVGDALILRPRTPGDRFCPLGLAGHSVKLNELMIDAEIAGRPVRLAAPGRPRRHRLGLRPALGPGGSHQSEHG